MSRPITFLPLRLSGTSPCMMRVASPSTIAVLPTPGYCGPNQASATEPSPSTALLEAQGTHLADEHGVVLGAAREDLHGAPDLFVAADDFIELALLGEGRDVLAVLLQRIARHRGVRVDVGRRYGLPATRVACNTDSSVPLIDVR